MRINFEFEWEVADGFRWLKQKRLDLTCKLKGHIWEKYKKQKSSTYDEILNRFYSSSLLYGSGFAQVGWGDNQVHTHTCKRCGEWKYKLIKRKPKTIKFRRYSQLK